ncbi:hypothetical protein [Streptomyces griseus]|nr:hypothetical protein [Streptomyces griseus]
MIHGSSQVLSAATEALACTATDVLLRTDLREEAWARHRAAMER